MVKTYTVWFRTKDGSGGYVVVDARTGPEALKRAKGSVVLPSSGDRVVKVSLAPLN